MFEREVLGDRGSDLDWVDLGQVRKMWDAHQSGAYRYGATLWALWLVKLWRRSLGAAPRAAKASEELTRVS